MPLRAAAELITGTRQHQLASCGWHDVATYQQRHERRPIVEVCPARGCREGVEPGAHRMWRRKHRLELQQQLSPRLLWIVFDEFLEVEDVRAEPSDTHRCDNRAHAPLARLTPEHGTAVDAHHHLLARVVRAGDRKSVV